MMRYGLGCLFTKGVGVSYGASSRSAQPSDIGDHDHGIAKCPAFPGRSSRAVAAATARSTPHAALRFVLYRPGFGALEPNRMTGLATRLNTERARESEGHQRLYANLAGSVAGSSNEQTPRRRANLIDRRRRLVRPRSTRRWRKTLRVGVSRCAFEAARSSVRKRRYDTPPCARPDRSLVASPRRVRCGSSQECAEDMNATGDRHTCPYPGSEQPQGTILPASSNGRKS